MDDKTMYIAAAANKKYLRYLYVMLTSLLCSNDGSNIRIYILNTDFDDADRGLLTELVKSYGADIVFPEIPREILEMGLRADRGITVEAYYRLLLAELVPQEADRILYLDSDLVVTGSLEEVYGTDLDGCIFAACRDNPAYSTGYLESNTLFRELKDDPGFVYVNSGVLLCNLSAMRDEINWRELLQKGVGLKDQLRFHDQDLINYVFHDRIKLLDDFRYNLVARTAGNSNLSVDRVRQECTIVHYAGPKPWNGKKLRYPLERFWWEYAARTPFYTEFLEEVVFCDTKEHYFETFLEELREENKKLRELNDKCTGILCDLYANTPAYSEFLEGIVLGDIDTGWKDRIYNELRIENTILRDKNTELMKRMDEASAAIKEKAGSAGRLVLFVGVYETLDLFIHEFEKEFIRLGYEVMIFDSGKMEESLARLGGFIKKPVTAAVTFNNLGYNMELIPGQNTWDALDVPIVNILVDHPYFYDEALFSSPARAVVLTIDRGHMTYLSRFYPGIRTVGFLPHGGSVPAATGTKPLSERSIDIIYAGGISFDYLDHFDPDVKRFGIDADKVKDKVIKMMTDDNSLTTEAAIEMALIEDGKHFSDDELRIIIHELYYVQAYVVSVYREKLIRTLMANGLRVTLYGRGWENVEWINDPCLDYRGRVSPQEIIELMADSKIVLNTMTWFKDGSHVRIFNGMLAGAVAVSDYSGYIREEFTDDEMVIFELSEIDALPGKIKSLFNNPDEMQAIADRGRKKAEKNHTWAHRARELHSDLLQQL